MRLTSQIQSNRYNDIHSRNTRCKPRSPQPSHASRPAAAVACMQCDKQARPHRQSAAIKQRGTYNTTCRPLDQPGDRCSRRGAVAWLISAVLLLGVHGALIPSAYAKAPRISVAGENLGQLSNEEVDKKRRKANFKRAHDGHVAIMNKYTKQWTDVKCDLQVPGLLLLREESGQVYYLGYAGLKQVDLSDDQVVAAIAADDWENNMKLVQAQALDGTIEALEMTREDFYQLVSLVSGQEGAEPKAAAAGSRQSDKRR